MQNDPNKNKNGQISKPDKKEDKSVNPYANLVPMSGEEMNMNEPDELFSLIDLCMYELPKHKTKIEYFKILLHDILETEKRILSNVIATVTDKNEIYLWNENLENVSIFPYLFRMR